MGDKTDSRVPSPEIPLTTKRDGQQNLEREILITVEDIYEKLGTTK